MKESSSRQRHASHGPWGDAGRHLPSDELERGLAALVPPKDVGRLELIVARDDDGHRETPTRVLLTPEGGVPGDAWARDCPHKTDAQITVMRADGPYGDGAVQQFVEHDSDEHYFTLLGEHPDRFRQFAAFDIARQGVLVEAH